MTTSIKNLLATLCLVLFPFSSYADEVTDVVNDVAAKLVQQLPMDKKIALKSLSPDETGLPEDFLRKLTSDLEAALLTASDFEINLANRLSMEEVWQEAVEFNNADFDELFKSANADVMLMMSPRAISTGVEIAITAYSLTGDDVGKTLASSGSVLLPIDLQANLGVDVNDLNKQMAQVLAEIEKVGQTGGLISSPNTYAEFYHNARLLQQRGEIDLAITNLQEAIYLGDKVGIIFADPILDLVDLIEAKYGVDAAPKYVEKRILNNVTNRTAELLNLALRSNYSLSEATIKLINNTADPVIALLWLNKFEVLHGEIGVFSDRYVRELRRVNGESGTYALRVAKHRARELLITALRQGDLFKNFIDDIRGQALSDRTLKGLGENGFPELYLGFTIFGAVEDIHSNNVGEPEFTHLSIYDAVTLRNSIEICVLLRNNIEKCKFLEYEELNNNQSLLSKKLRVRGDLPEWVEVFWFSADYDNRYRNPKYLFDWTSGIRCVKSISYRDAFGYQINVIPGRRNLINLMAVSTSDRKKIESCYENEKPKVSITVGKKGEQSDSKRVISQPRNSKPLSELSQVTCYITNKTSKIINVQNFTNLRQQAGLNGRVIGKVPLGETVQIVNPGRFLRYDRCAAACNGANQNAIKQCIDNNDVWIEVQYNGRRGFLSRKFLE